jgi:transposase
MRQTEVLQETRMMRFREAYGGWQKSNLTQVEAAKLSGVCERTFRRYINRYEEKGLEGLFDKRLKQTSHRRAPLDEVLAVTELYSKCHMGWNVKLFHSWYRRDGGSRSYTWVKNRLQEKVW